jgi:hypothetical protein
LPFNRNLQRYTENRALYEKYAELADKAGLYKSNTPVSAYRS